MAVAVLGLVLLWPVCLVWVSSSLLLAFFPFPVSKERAATQEPTNFSSGSGDPAVWHRPENRNLFRYPLAVWDFGSLHQKPWVGGTFCRVLRDGSGGWQSPVPRGRQYWGASSSTSSPTIVCLSRRLVPNLVMDSLSGLFWDFGSLYQRRCGVVSDALSRQPSSSSTSLRRLRLGVAAQASGTSFSYVSASPDVVLTFLSSILSRFVSPLLIFPTALSGSSVEVPPCRAIGSQNRFHHVPQCAQGKVFSRVTEPVPPIFRSIEDNGSSAAISVEAGRSFRDAPSITASFLSFPRLLSVARFPLGLGIGRPFFHLFGSVAMCSLLLAPCLRLRSPLPPCFGGVGYCRIVVFRWGLLPFYFGVLVLWLWRLRVHAVLEYMDIDPLKFASAPGPSGDRGGMPLMASWGRWWGMPPAVRRTSDIFPWSLYSLSQRSCRPQPLGSRREAAPCEDTRQDR